MKRFERSNGLDTALYKNYIYLFFYIVQLHPEWELNGTKLTETDSVTYLGVTLSYVKPNIGPKC